MGSSGTIEPLFRLRCDRLPRQTPLHQPRHRAVGTPDLTHTQLPSRTACRRCLTLPEPRVLASALSALRQWGLCSVTASLTHCTRTHRSLPQVFHFTWTGLALTHAFPSVCDGSLLFPQNSCCAPLLTGTHLAVQMPD